MLTLLAFLLVGASDGDAVRVGGSIAKPERTVYEDPARSSPGLTPLGIMILELTVDEAGQVQDVAFVRGGSLKDAIDVAAVKRWRYSPTLVAGRPVRIALRELIEFFPTPDDKALFYAHAIQERKESKGYRLFALEQLRIAASKNPDVIKALRKVASDSDQDIAIAASKVMEQGQ
jgi:hypothetical protein